MVGAVISFDYNPRPCALTEEIFYARPRASPERRYSATMLRSQTRVTLLTFRSDRTFPI